MTRSTVTRARLTQIALLGGFEATAITTLSDACTLLAFFEPMGDVVRFVHFGMILSATHVGGSIRLAC